MRLRKVFVSVLAVLMLISAMPFMAFAEVATNPDGNEKPEPTSNFYAFLGREKEDCVEKDSLADAKVSVMITKDADPGVSVKVPVSYDKEWEWFEVDTHIEGEAMETILADLTANQAEYGDILNLDELGLGAGTDSGEGLATMTELKKKMSDAMEEAVPEQFDIFKGYTVTVEGLPGDHYTSQIEGVVMTSELVVQTFDLLVAVIEELFTEMGMQLPEKPESYGDFMNMMAEMSGYASYEEMCADLEMTEAEIDEELAAIAESDLILSQAREGVYPGQLNLTISFRCECPDLEPYEIYHEYYKESNGKRTLVARIAEGEPDQFGDYYLMGEVGDYIMAEDYIQCEFDGDTYEFVNSYDSFVVMDETPNWEEGIVTEFKLGDFEYFGLCLRYVLVEEAAEEPVIKPVDTEVQDKDEVDVDEEAVQENSDPEDEAPLTGDHTPIGLYVALFVTAIAAAAALVVYKKKK